MNNREKYMPKKRGRGRMDYRTKELIISLVFALVMILSSVLFVAFAASQTTEVEYMGYIVKAGDTLWSIADEHAGNHNLKDVIALIKEKNEMRDSTIYAGDIILVPILSAKDK